MEAMSSLNIVDEDEEPFVEIDPTGRYGRYKELLGEGGQKKVYRGFDQIDGIEVAWNQVDLRKLSGKTEMLDQLKTEVKLLRSLKHEKILSLYHSWVDSGHNRLNFITEVCTSGSLLTYTKNHRRVSKVGIRKWCRQILRGLEYLHTHKPCIIHGDIKTDNIFINGNKGEVKIGDFGMSRIVGEDHIAHKINGGTLEFMAPEMYNGSFTEKIDIYAFGMCLMEMVTRELPYLECKSRAEIMKRVSSGIKPHCLEKVNDPQIKAFIIKCTGTARNRPSATELLQDPFFYGLDDGFYDDDE